MRASVWRPGGRAGLSVALYPPRRHVAFANSRLIALGRHDVTFSWKDYPVEGHDRQKRMTTWMRIRRMNSSVWQLARLVDEVGCSMIS